MSRMRIKNIIFDFGGVLFDWNPRYLYDDLFEDKAELEYFLSHVCSPAWNEQQDAGRPWEEAISLAQQRHPKYHDLIRRYRADWEVMLRGTIDTNIKLIPRIKEKQYGLYGLTNWSADTFELTRNKYPFLNEFDGIVVSGEEKLIKPDPEIYILLLERYQLEANECLFIDDNLSNIEMSKSLGFEGIHYVKDIDLEGRLKQHGI